MKRSKIDDFFTALEMFIKETKLKNTLSCKYEIIIPIFKNHSGKYNIYYGIRASSCSESTEKNTIFGTEKEFLSSYNKKMLERGTTGVCLENVSESELNEILFAFNMKFFASLGYKDNSELSVVKFSSSIDTTKAFDNLCTSISIAFAKNIIDKDILQKHYEGAKVNRFFSTEIYEKRNLEPEINKMYYEIDYKYYLDILRKTEKIDLLNSMKKAYILVNSEIIDIYNNRVKNYKNDKLDGQPIIFTSSDAFIKQRINEAHSS